MAFGQDIHLRSMATLKQPVRTSFFRIGDPALLRSVGHALLTAKVVTE